MFYDKNVIYQFRGIFGVPVDIGSSILMLGFLYIGFSMSNPAELIWAASVFSMLLLSIYLHELGHAFGCQVQGIPVRRIMLYGGGGFCEPSRSANNYQNELIVALGPIVNFSLWAVTSLFLTFMLSISDENSTLIFELYPYLDTFALINLALGLLNMLPLHPLDGGKLFYLLLSRFMQPRFAQKASGLVGVVFSVLWWPALLVFYLSTGWFLLFAPSIRQHWVWFRR